MQMLPQIVSWCLTALSILLAFATVLRNKKTDDSQAARTLEKLMTQIGVLQGQVTELNAKLDRKDQQHVLLIERITWVEASAKQAHKRLDEHLAENKP